MFKIYTDARICLLPSLTKTTKQILKKLDTEVEYRKELYIDYFSTEQEGQKVVNYWS